MNKFRYTFYVDGDVFENLTYERYLENYRLRKKVMDVDRARLFLGLEVHSYGYDYLQAHSEVKDKVNYLRRDWLLNRLKYYCPNSKEQLEFLNDWGEHDIVALVAPNRVGKTTTGVIKALLSGIIELDPEWPIFKKHGVQWRKRMNSDNDITFAFGSYEWSHIKTTVWPRLRDYIPDTYLGQYSRANGRRGKDPNLERKPFIDLEGINTTLKFHAYSQSQSNYESAAYNGFMWDEQPPEALFNAVDERLRTLRGSQYFTLTPHKVEGRPDTGGGGWLQKFLTGNEKRGHKVSCYNTSLADVPDWIYPESEKHKAFEKWIHEPTRLRNVKMLREGRSRVLGEWHMTSGLVIDDWDKRVHIVDDFEIPENYTLYRGVDHGITNPTACLWAAVSPPQKDVDSTVFIYREFYSNGRTIYENVGDIVRLSGNMRRQVSSISDPRTGVSMIVWEEVPKKEYYAKTVLDSRSFAAKDTNTGKPYGYIYKSCGLPCMPASGRNSEHWTPLLKELFTVDYNKKHPLNTGTDGASKIYIFRSCVNIIREIEGWVWEEYVSGNDRRNRKETPRKKDDHGCTALAYLCQIPMRYRGDLYRPASFGAARNAEYAEMIESSSDYRGI